MKIFSKLKRDEEGNRKKKAFEKPSPLFKTFDALNFIIIVVVVVNKIHHRKRRY